MAGTKSDFVLDDDLDEDEEILQIHSEQLPEPAVEPIKSKDIPIPDSLQETTQSSVGEKDDSNRFKTVSGAKETPNPEPGSTSIHAKTNVPRIKAAQPTAVIVDGLPISATRADLDALLGASASAITNVRLRRLEQYGLLRVRVQFENENITATALEKDGTKFNDCYVSIKPASYERWDAAVNSVNNLRVRSRSREVDASPNTSSSALQRKSSGGLPDLNSVSKSFWSAFGAARQTAEKLEKRARELGQKLEHQLQVNEKVEAGKARMQEIDRDLNVSGKVSEFAQASRETAMAVDDKLNISQGVSHVVGGVGEAARKVAREVDENLRLSDKAKDVTNAALSSPKVGGVARKVVNRMDGAAVTSKKNYQPRRLDYGDTAGAINTGKDTAGGNILLAENHSADGEASRSNPEVSDANQNESKHPELERESDA